jgi:hypothetical protein
MLNAMNYNTMEFGTVEGMIRIEKRTHFLEEIFASQAFFFEKSKF